MTCNLRVFDVTFRSCNCRRSSHLGVVASFFMFDSCAYATKSCMLQRCRRFRSRFAVEGNVVRERPSEKSSNTRMKRS